MTCAWLASQDATCCWLLQGIDLKEAQRKLQDLGFAPAAHLMLTAAWRKDSPRYGCLVGYAS